MINISTIITIYDSNTESEEEGHDPAWASTYCPAKGWLFSPPSIFLLKGLGLRVTSAHNKGMPNTHLRATWTFPDAT